MSGNDQRSETLKGRLRSIVPTAWLREREMFLRLGPSAGRAYLRLRLFDKLGARSGNCRKTPPHARSLVFVCFGNIMRSPMAEALFRRAATQANLHGFTAISAGIHAVPGNSPHPWALRASEDMGLPLAGHRARLLTPELVAQADVLFAMDFQNKAELMTLYPGGRPEVLMLSAYGTGVMRGREIRDPFFADVEGTRRCYHLLQMCIENLVEELSRFVPAPAASHSGLPAAVGGKKGEVDALAP